MQQACHDKERAEDRRARQEESRTLRDDKLEVQQELVVLEELKGELDAKHEAEYAELLRANADLCDEGERLKSELYLTTEHRDKVHKQVHTLMAEAAELAVKYSELKDEARKAVTIKAKSLLQERRIEDMKANMATLHENMAQAEEAERLQRESAHAASRNSTQNILRLEAEKLAQAEELDALKAKYKESKRREKKLATHKCYCCCQRHKKTATVAKPAVGQARFITSTKSRQPCVQSCCSTCICKRDTFKC